MRMVIFGAGYVGLVSAACFANMGNMVTCVDVIPEKIEALNKGVIPIYEPGLQEIVRKNVGERRLFFTTDAIGALEEADVAFICVGTPQGDDGRANMEYVYSVAKTIGQHMKNYLVVVTKSTVPVGTADKVAEIIRENQGTAMDFAVVSNPEFLREGEAIRDFMTPDRIVIGVDSDRAKELMVRLYKGIARTGKPIVITDVKSAELIKYAANSLLATKISFMNEISRLCEKVGGDVKEVARGIGLDSRIGPRFLQAGIGYGGSCFPKDVQALVYTAQQAGLDFSILAAVHRVNEEQKRSLFPKIKDALGDLQGKTVAVFGLSFKPKTDDIREAPSCILIQQLLDAGVTVRTFDPAAMDNMKKLFPGVTYTTDAYTATEDADCLVLVTEWDDFRYLDMTRIKKHMRSHHIIDGRNMYDPNDMQDHGFNYVGIGRGKPQ